MNMQSYKQSIDPLQKCELCEQKMNPTAKIYKNHIHLCKACFHYMGGMPEIAAKRIERFLIGNVV